MPELGYAAILTAFIIAAYTAVASFVAARGRIPELWLSARSGVLASFALVTIASLALLYALVTRDFSVRYVAAYTDSDLSLPYTLGAWWAGQEGSLLLWAWLLSLFAVIVVIQRDQRDRQLVPYVTAVMMAVLAYFLGMIGFTFNPFEKLPLTLADGQGLNPLLENPGMLFHPPMLYLGYVAFTVPFAFAIAALITGRLGDEWLRASRRWTLFAWVALGLGNLLGAEWAYTVLGWGGYWGWDPVENAGFLPWLAATAFLHSAMIQQRRGMLKVWNMILIIATFALCLFGTLVARSGILSSVHSFAAGPIGPLLLALLIVVLVGSLWLLWVRLPALRSDHELDSIVSREASFLLNNLLLVGAGFAIFWGTVFPLVSEAVTGTKTTVGPAFFDQVVGPIFLALIVLMGICPLIAWRKASIDRLARNFVFPLLAALVVAALLYLGGLDSGYALLAFTSLAFASASILLEFYRALRARHRSRGESYLLALPRLMWSNKPRYGGYVAHAGVIIMALGIVGSQMLSTSAEGTLAPGESMQIRDYALTFQGLSSRMDGDAQIMAASLQVSDNGNSAGTVEASKSFVGDRGEPVSNVAIRSTLVEDLYVILAGWDEDGKATFKVLVNPLMMWIWIGGAVLVLGTALAFWPDARAESRLPVSRQASAEGMKPGHA